MCGSLGGRWEGTERRGANMWHSSSRRRENTKGETRGRLGSVEGAEVRDPNFIEAVLFLTKYR